MPKLTILAAMVDYRSSDATHLSNTGDEIDRIQQALSNYIKIGMCEVKVIVDLTAEKLVNAFASAENPIVGFHYAGHSTEDLLILQEDAHKKGLAEFLGQQEGLKFVFLNGCSSEGHIADLHKNGIPAVIGTSSSIPDQLSKEIAVSFYSHLGQGLGLDDAFANAIASPKMKDEVYRDVISLGKKKEEPLDGLWKISYKKGASAIMQGWNLPVAFEQPLLGLPEVTIKNPPAEPYRYLEHYSRKHASVFFGRGYKIKELYEKVTNYQQNPILFVYGSSGVGKSSLLEAGLIPRLERDYQIEMKRRDAQTGLPVDLSQLLASGTGDSLLEQWKSIEKQHDKALIIILDQVEEVFTQPLKHNEELQQLSQAAHSIFGNLATRPKGKLLLSFRKEYLAEITSAFQQQGLSYTECRVSHMNENDVKEAITGPYENPFLKEHYNLGDVEDNLPEIIANDLLKSNSLKVAPILQVLLTEAWKKLDDYNRSFTIDLYNAVSRDGVQLENFVDKKLSLLSDQEALTSGLVLDMLNSFTSERVSAAAYEKEEIIARYGSQNGKTESLLKDLNNHYLLARIEKGQQVIYRLAHDTLAPIIRKRYDNSLKPGQAAQRIITAAGPKTSADPLSKKQLQVVLAGKKGMKSWSEEESQWIQHSVDAIKKQKKKRRNLGILIGTILLLGVLATAWAANNEIQNRKLDKSRLLSYQADLLAETAPTEAIKLYQQSIDIIANPLIEQKLYDCYRTHLLAKVIYPAPGQTKETEQPPNVSAISPGGRYIFQAVPLKADAHKIIAFEWNGDSLITKKPTISETRSRLRDLAFSGSGEYVFGAGKSHQIHSWNIDIKADTTRQYKTPDHFFRALAANHDGSLVSSITEVAGQALLQIWDVKNDSLFHSIPIGQEYGDIAFSSDGQFILAGIAPGVLGMYNQQGEEVQRWQGATNTINDIAVHQAKVAVALGNKIMLFEAAQGTLALQDSISNEEGATFYNVAFSPDGSTLIGASRRQGAFLWRLDNQQLLFNIKDYKGPFQALAFTKTGDAILGVDASGTIRLWAVPVMFPNQILHHSRACENIKIHSTDTKVNILGTISKTIAEWDVSDEDLKNRHKIHEDKIMAFERSETHGFTGDEEGYLQSWTLSDFNVVDKKQAHTSEITKIALAPDNKHLLTVASGENAFAVWDVGADISLIDSTHSSTYISELAFTSDSKYIWLSTPDSTITIWPVQNLDHPIDSFHLSGMGEPRWISFSNKHDEVLIITEQLTSETGLMVFTTLEGEILRTIEIEEGLPIHFAANQEGENSLYAFGMQDGKILLANEKGYVFQELSIASDAFIYSIDWRGKYLVVSSSDGNVLVWDSLNRPPLFEE